MSTILKEHRLPNFVGGKWSPSNTREVLPVPNPATEEVLALVPLSKATEVDAAVQAAQKAFVTWKETPVTERVRILLKFRELLVQHLDSLSRTLTEENGKTLNEAKAEIWRGIEVVEFAAGMPSLMKGEVTPPGLPRDRYGNGPLPCGGGGGDYPIQLSGDGASVDGTLGAGGR
ncbi:MAG: aldehyde dehydrogenase family protein [Thermoactinomyces sp.]